MTNDQTILLAGVRIAAALSIDDDLEKLQPQEAVNQFFKYLDTAVPALKDRADYYAQQYDLDVAAGAGKEVSGVIGEFTRAVGPELISKLLELVRAIPTTVK